MKRSEREATAVGSHHLLRVSQTSGRPKEAFEGAEMVHEVPLGLALLLIHAYRSVMSWALSAPADHAELFAPGAEEEVRELLRATPVPDALRPELEVICDLLAGPVEMNPRRVAEACVRIADWAERREDAPSTAFRFIQAAGMCAPNDARLAYRAGSMARQRGTWDLAELWFRHAIAVGRRTRDWEGHARAYVGLGYTYLEQVKFTSARREALKALRVAKRHGLREVEAKAYHDLFVIATCTSDLSTAEEHARAAFYAYGPTHPAIPALAHDLAHVWNVRGEFHRSLPVYRALLPHFRQPEHRFRVLTSLGRAAGATGDFATFESAWREAWALFATTQQAQALCRSILELAHGAACAAEWSRAREATNRALQIASERSEADVVADAEALLHQLSEQEHAGPTGAHRTAHGADPLVTDLVTSLEASAPVL